MVGCRVFLGLVHYPIYNKKKEVVATSITNLDIHDISRCAATYDVQQYFLIHPHPSQHQLAQELLEYWTQGYGAEYNPDRCQALQRIRVVETLAGAEEYIRHNFGGAICKVVTDAHCNPGSTSYAQLRERMAQAGVEIQQPINYLLLFGTGYGLTEEVMTAADVVLEPILGRGDYNHLSVRSAVSIILDRLLGPAWFESNCKTTAQPSFSGFLK